jgi:hypothetical protein
VVVGFRILLIIPETDGYGFIPFRGDEADLILKSLLLTE